MELPPTYIHGFHDVDAVSRMKYTELGETGMKVSFLGFGGGCFGNQYGDFNFEDAENAVREALKSGVNYIDTAPYYGEGKSEQTLGKILKSIPRWSYYIATKVGRYSQDPRKAFDFSREAVLRSVDDSLNRLGLHYVDVIQIHDVEFAPSIDVIINETLPALEEVVLAGKAKFIGITGYPLNTLWEIIEKSQTRIRFVLTYCRHTLMDDTLKDYLPKFQSKGIGVIHASPTAMGLLTNKGSYSWHPGNLLLKQICDKAGNFCKEKQVELGDIAVYHTMKQPGIDVHLIGMPNIDFVKRNLQMMNYSQSGYTYSKFEDPKLEIFKRFFVPSDRKHWENVELNKYRETCQELELE